MVELVNSLLNVSRIDVGSFAITPVACDIVKICESVVHELMPSIKDKNLQVETHYQPISEFEADPQLMRIIFQNLASNAVKYTPSNGKIVVTIGRNEDGSVAVIVNDTGYGIPESQQDKVFQKLFRADNVTSQAIEGTGLGLYVVKSIVEQSGGSIRFESEENKGTTFYVTFPKNGMDSQDGTKELTA